MVQTPNDCGLDALELTYPLFFESRCQYDMNGVIYFDRDRQAELEKNIQAEKLALIEQSQASKDSKKSHKIAPQPELHCDTLITHDAYLQLNNGAQK